jgi:D-amino acid aminotransferase
MSTHGRQVVLLNGRFVPAARAQISVLDRGLQYGDGVFETLRAYRGAPFALDAHVARLRRSAEFLGIRVPRRSWERDIDLLLRRNRLTRSDAWVRITLTRGVGPRGLLPPARATPTVIGLAGALSPSIAEAQRHGVRVALLPFARHGFLAEHKVLNYLPGVLGRVMAARHDAFEGIFVNDDAKVTEGTTTNVFVWQRGRLLTPPIDGILPGLTRRMILEAAAADGAHVLERSLAANDLVDADEAFLTSSVIEVVPIIAVNARRVGAGKVGPRTQRIQEIYRQIVGRAMAARPRD